MDTISRIVFICSGNTCRSPMALAIAQREVEQRRLGVQLDSAGISATSGDHASQNAVTVCAELGLDISAHHAQRFDDEGDDSTTLFVVMTRQHMSWLRFVEMIPEDRIYLLGDGVPDPFGGSLEEYRVARDIIAREIHALFDRIAAELPKAWDEPAKKGEMTEYYIYPLTGDCVPAVAELERINFADRWTAALFAEETDNSDSTFLVAIGNDASVYGYGGILVAADVAQLPKLCVREQVRRRGVATALVNALADAARERGAAELTLEVRVSNAPAIALYKKMGFVDMGVRPGFYTQPKEDALIMTKQLLPKQPADDVSAPEEQ